MVSSSINLLKYKLIRYIEQFPSISLLIYNNIFLFKFLFPHEKDYFGIRKILSLKKEKNSMLDIGANNGISSMGFRRLGFKNPIYLFEPNPYLYKKYLLNLKKKDKANISYII